MRQQVQDLVLEPENRFPLGTNKYLVLSREPTVLLNFPGVSAGKLGFKSILLVHLQCYAALANNENVK